MESTQYGKSSFGHMWLLLSIIQETCTSIRETTLGFPVSNTEGTIRLTRFPSHSILVHHPAGCHNYFSYFRRKQISAYRFFVIVSFDLTRPFKCFGGKVSLPHLANSRISPLYRINEPMTICDSSATNGKRFNVAPACQLRRSISLLTIYRSLPSRSG